MRSILLWLGSLMATAAAVAISYQWLDRPIALIAHHYFRRPNRGILDRLTDFSDPLILLAVVVLVTLGLKALYGRSLSNLQAAAFVCSLSVLFSEAAKDQLKFI